MNASSMWQCPNCGEQHQEMFDVCWKCGSDSTGNRDVDFCISEPVREQNQRPESPADAQLPAFQLPTITYFSIPPYLALQLITTFNNFEHVLAPGPPRFSLSPVESVLYGVGFVLIGVPMFFTMVRVIAICIVRRPNSSEITAYFLQLLFMFRLPESLRRSQRWFVPVYYGSFAAVLLAPFAFAAWFGIRLIWQ